MAATGLPLALLTMASLALAAVYVCNSFIMDAWMRREWNRLTNLRQDLRKVRTRQLFTHNRLAQCRESLVQLQLEASQLERRVQSLPRQGVSV